MHRCFGTILQELRLVGDVYKNTLAALDIVSGLTARSLSISHSLLTNDTGENV